MPEPTRSQRDLDLQILEHIYDQDDSQGYAFIGPIRKLVGDEDTAAVTCRGLRDRGLLRTGHRSGEYHVTATGRAEVDAVRSRRRDRGLRRRLCRNELLRWIDSKDATDSGSRVGRDRFDVAVDLEPFTTKETEAAAEYLKGQGLIESISAAGAEHILLWITELGQECIDDEDGDVAAFVRKRSATSSGSQIFHISGSGNNVAAAIGDNNEVSASLSTFDPQLAMTFADAVEQANLDLDGEQVRELVANIKQSDDPSRAQRATALLQTMVVGTTTGTLGQVLGVLGANALGIGT